MPLLAGKKNIGTNIKEMEAAGHSPAQSKAAALSKAYGPKKKKVKAKVKKAKKKMVKKVKKMMPPDFSR